MARDREIDHVIEHLYEDNVAGESDKSMSTDIFMDTVRRYTIEIPGMLPLPEPGVRHTNKKRSRRELLRINRSTALIKLYTDR